MSNISPLKSQGLRTKSNQWQAMSPNSRTRPPTQQNPWSRSPTQQSRPPGSQASQNLNSLRQSDAWSTMKNTAVSGQWNPEVSRVLWALRQALPERSA